MCAEVSGAGSDGCLCRYCFEDHTQRKLPGHQVTPPDSEMVKMRGDREILLGDLGVYLPPKLCAHYATLGGEAGHLAYFCPDDGALFCCSCVHDHRAHSYVEIPAAASACRSHLSSLVDSHGTWPAVIAALVRPRPNLNDTQTLAIATLESAARPQLQAPHRASRVPAVEEGTVSALVPGRVEDGIVEVIAELKVSYNIALLLNTPTYHQHHHLLVIQQVAASGIRSAAAAAESGARAAYNALVAAATAR